MGPRLYLAGVGGHWGGAGGMRRIIKFDLLPSRPMATKEFAVRW